MNILVVGCGKLGSQLCAGLEKDGHTVSVVEQDPALFSNLPDYFAGYTVTGVPIDQEVLRQAGIEACDVVAAVTPDDNMNVMVCQMASTFFHVPRVLARIYDPARSEVFRQFGLHTICPNNLAVDAIMNMLQDQIRVETVHFDASSVAFDAKEAPKALWGKAVGALCGQNGNRQGLFGLLHPDGNMTLAHVNNKRKIAEGDRLVYVRVID